MYGIRVVIKHTLHGTNTERTTLCCRRTDRHL